MAQESPAYQDRRQRYDGILRDRDAEHQPLRSQKNERAGVPYDCQGGERCIHPEHEHKAVAVCSKLGEVVRPVALILKDLCHVFVLQTSPWQFHACLVWR